MQTLPGSFDYNAATYRRQLLSDAEAVRPKRPSSDDVPGAPSMPCHWLGRIGSAVSMALRRKPVAPSHQLPLLK